MATRTVLVRLAAAATNFNSGMRSAATQAARTAGDIRRSMADASRRTSATMNRIAAAGEQSLGALRGGSLALIAAFAGAVYTAEKFEKAMSGVGAVTQASAEDMSRMREAALEAGRTTQYSATQAAGAIEELAKAGISVTDIVNGGLHGALSLAAAAQVDLAEAAEIAATSMVVFGLSGQDVGHVADVLAAAANKSATDVHQLGLSLKMVGQVAAQSGIGIEETVGALALFASEGLKGSDAGTSLKVMLQRLVPASNEAAELMDSLGFSAYDANGEFIGLTNVAGELANSFRDLTPEARASAMNVIFGADAVRAAGILYKNGAEGLGAFVDAVDDQGYAAAVASTRMDNLTGDINLLRAALETALIESGSAANSVMREMTQWVTGLINAYSSLPAPLQQATVLLGGFLGVLGLIGASLMLFVPRIAAVKAEMIAMGFTAQSTGRLLRGFGAAAGVIGAVAALSYGVGELRQKFADAGPGVKELTDSILDFNRVGEATGALAEVAGTDLDDFAAALSRIVSPSNKQRIDDFVNTISFNLLEGMGEDLPFKQATAELKLMDEALSGLVASGAADEAAQMWTRLTAAVEANGNSVDDLWSQMPLYTEALAGMSVETKTAADSQDDLGDEVSITKQQLEDQRSAAEALSDALNLLNGAAISAAEAEIAFRGSIDDLTTTIDENGRSLDITTEKGRENKSAILDLAKAAQTHAERVAEQTGSQEEGNRVLNENIALLRETLREAGYTESEIRELTDAYAQLPDDVLTEVGAPGATHTIEQMETLYGRIEDLPDGHTITVSAPTEDVIRRIENVGYTVERLPDRTVKITAPTDGARAAVQSLRTAIDNLRDRTVTLTTINRSSTWTDSRGHAHQQARAGGGRVHRLADGGAVSGPGSSTSDDIPAWLSDGEYVIRAAAVRKYGLGMFDQINAMRFAKGGAVKKKTAKAPAAVTQARKDIPGDLRDFTRSLTGSASNISSAAKALRTDLNKLGREGKALAQASKATTSRLQSLAKSRTKISDRIDEARGYGSNVRSSILGSLALGDDPTAFDLIRSQKSQLSAAKRFRRDIASLQDRGLRKDLLEQVIEQGPGSQLAKVLLAASDKQIKELNALAKSGASLAKKTGNDAANAMFDAGRQAGKGFLSGLKAQEAAIQAQMDRIGASMVSSIKRKLKIKSPSQVMRDEVGRQIGAGLAIGLDRSRVDVERAAGRLYAAVDPPPLSGRRYAGAVAPAAQMGEMTAQVNARIYIGDREITDIVRVETDSRFDRLGRALAARRAI
ncbi:phage tail tape measure protein [Streptomyces harbinensis]|uniref:phage tail tape measure protein n=1 Tax=Streptomyces harbinensis TaxID=1176198 RepID=UPI0036AC857D